MGNPFQSELDKFFSQIIDLKGTFFHVQNMFKNDLKKHIKATNESNNNFAFRSASRLIISDISGETDDGWEINFPTDYTKVINWTGYSKEVEKMIARQGAYTIAQSCEAFVRYLKDIVSIQLYHHKAKASKFDKAYKQCDTVDKFRTAIEHNYHLRNTENLFLFLEKTSKEFKKSKKNNNLGFDLTDFYQVVAFVRHKVTHTSARFESDEIEDWDSELKGIFENYFNTREISDDESIIFMDKHKTNRVVKRIAELGFIIFKSLSISNGYKWKMIIE